MTYQETLTYLFNATPVFEHVGATAYKEGLENTLLLDEHFGHPHRRFKTIHVAGTNGKGSCSHTIASILQACGYRVGLYTSPHLVDFRERIKVNGHCISEKDVIDFVEQEKKFFEPLHPSFFELTTALAFKFFAEEKVDWAVVEVGLGGRLDCTNIVTPELSVITNISFDHTGFLGNTLSAIANEKAGIIKEGKPVVIGEHTEETRLVFLKKAHEKRAPIIFAQEEPEIMETKETGSGLVCRTRSFGQVVSPLTGDYQKKNLNTILTTASLLIGMGVIVERENVGKGIAQVISATGLQGRWQTLSEHPKTVCDTGHNVGGWEYLGKQIGRQTYTTLRIVFGMVDDKDLDHVMEILPQDATYYFTKAHSKRAIPEEKVRQEGIKHKLHGNSYDCVKNAYLQAIKDADADDFIFVGGSSYVVADLLEFLQHNH